MNETGRSGERNPFRETVITPNLCSRFLRYSNDAECSWVWVDSLNAQTYPCHTKVHAAPDWEEKRESMKEKDVELWAPRGPLENRLHPSHESDSRSSAVTMETPRYFIWVMGVRRKKMDVSAVWDLMWTDRPLVLISATLNREQMFLRGLSLARSSCLCGAQCWESYFESSFSSHKKVCCEHY